jgi:four helix bundle protein
MEKISLANQAGIYQYSATNKDFAHYLDNALGSAHEVKYTCYLICDLGFIGEDIYNIVNKEINEVKAMLIAFIKHLRDEN